MQIAKIKGINLDSQPHTLIVTLDEDGEAVYESVHELTAWSDNEDVGQSFVLEEGLPDSRGDFTLTVTMDDTRTKSIELASKYGGNILQIIVDIDEQGRLTFYVSRTPL